MNQDVVEDSFKGAAEKVEKAHQDAVDALRTKVAQAKSETLKKIKS
jgi:hypothetical protein